MPDGSYIKVFADGTTSHVGPEATEIYRVQVLRQALKLHAVGIKPSRAWTLRAVLDATQRVTGQTYPSRRAAINQAQLDLESWLEDHPVQVIREGAH